MKKLAEYININEASDLVPEHCDGAADWAADFYKETIKLLIKKCDECWEYADKHADKDKDSIFSHAAWSWSIIGMVRPYLEMLVANDKSWYINEEIIDILYTALHDCEESEEWINSWRDPSEYEEALSEQRKLIDKLNHEKMKIDKKYPRRKL